MSKKKKIPANFILSFRRVIVLSGLTILAFGFLHTVTTLPANPPQSKLHGSISENLFANVLMLKTPAPTPTPKPTPLPYPPIGYHCVNVPILMYHHVQPLVEAKALGHAQLTVDSGIFATQMQYLVDHGYSITSLRTLSDYFDSKATIPKKPVILTFDDGYDDFSNFAVPILSAHNFVSEAFIPTGLMENPGYMTWGQIKDASTKGVMIDHHTWSHANIAVTSDAFFHRELDIATQQLLDHGYGPVTIFAYPYGTHDGHDIGELAKRGFTLAVTTLPGRIQCKEDRLALHRTRVGNSSLASYGL